MSIALHHVLLVSSIVFIMGIMGVITAKKSIITILMSIELMLLAVNINLVAFSVYNGDLSGQLFTFFILTVAAAEAAIGLAILVSYQKHRNSIDVQSISELGG